MADDVRVNMSTHNLRSAVFAVREAVAIEKSSTEQLVDEYLTRIKVANNEMGKAVARADPHWPAHTLLTYVSSAILLSACTIESAVNEFFVDAVERSNWVQELGDRTLRHLAALWEEWLREKQLGTLEKTQIALTATGHRRFNKGRAPYQDADDLFFLRNSLVHFVPEWLTNQDRHERIEKRLRSYGFRPNPFAAKDSPFFPGQCLGSDCACWAVRTAHSFVLTFFKRMGIESMSDVWQIMGYYLQDFENWEPIARREAA